MKEKRKLMKRLREFLKMRADNLLYKAVSGFYQYTKDHEIQRKLRKFSAFFFLEKVLRKHFTAFKNQFFLKRLGDKTFTTHYRNTTNNFYKLWV